MAWNVYVTFFKRYSPQNLRKLEGRYAGICYGCPLGVSFVYLIADSKTAKPIYGPATVGSYPVEPSNRNIADEC
jgi:hypothetical protein